MAHQWKAGALAKPSWHEKEELRDMATAEAQIKAGEETGAWPMSVSLEKMNTMSGLAVPGSAVVATYLDGSKLAHGAVGGKYTPLDPAEWRETVKAAVAAGAKPDGAFSLAGGSKLLATFEIPDGDGLGIKNHLLLVDSLDGSTGHIAGGTRTRTVCKNTLDIALREDGRGMAKLKHTASINERTKFLRAAIETSIKEGQAVRELYKKAKDLRLKRQDADAIFDLLFPPAAEGETKTVTTRAENKRTAAKLAMIRPENREGDTLASIWNAATWLVDRDENGAPKKTRGGADPLESLLFGSRAKRVQEIQNVIEVVLKDGTVKSMPVPGALASGVDPQSVGRTLLEEMLG